MTGNPLDPLLKPRSVALIGASARAGSVGNDMIKVLRDGGFDGDIWAINPKYDRGHFELASVLERLGKLEEAVREYEVASRSYTSSGEYYYRLGFTYYRLGKLTKARENLIRVRSVSPGSPASAKADELLETIE